MTTQLEEIKELCRCIRNKNTGKVYYTACKILPYDLALCNLISERIRCMPSVMYVSREVKKCFSVDPKTHKLVVDNELLNKVIKENILKC